MTKTSNTLISRFLNQEMTHEVLLEAASADLKFDVKAVPSSWQITTNQY